jgi:hypothetical protein
MMGGWPHVHATPTHPCNWCSHQCEAAAAAPAADDTLLAELVDAYIKARHLPSYQERFARLAARFDIRRRV